MSKGTGSERFMAIGDISVILIGTRGDIVNRTWYIGTATHL